MAQQKIRGVVFYEGPSCIDGKPIIGVATFGTDNQKTGNLVQTWIIRSDMHPVNAMSSGQDESICGSCPLRGRIAPASERYHKDATIPGDTANKGRSCYVLVQNAPTNIFLGYNRGIYPKLSSDHRRLMMGRGLRYGSYGDPVAIPMKYWDELSQYCTGKAEPGYTHQWKDQRFSEWSARLMASTHSVAENNLAHSMGWRTFRTVGDITQLDKNEIICPASEAGGFKANCETCGACNGRRDTNDRRKNIAIVSHGGGGKIQMLQQIITKATPVAA